MALGSPAECARLLHGAPPYGRQDRAGRRRVALVERLPVAGHRFGNPVDRVHDLLRGEVTMHQQH